MLAPQLGIAKRDTDLNARFISRWKYRFSSDQRSQATLSSVSTDVGDQSGTQSDLAFLFFAVFTPLSLITSLQPWLISRFFRGARNKPRNHACVRISGGRLINSQIRSIHLRITASVGMPGASPPCGLRCELLHTQPNIPVSA